MTEMRLEAKDEFPHAIESVANFNESLYFNLFDPDQRAGGWMRIGNRPNEGYAEVSCCLYLPDHAAGFMYRRPAIEGNEAFDAGGMRFEVHEPFERFSARYEGPILLLRDPSAMAEPGRAFKENPQLDCLFDLSLRGVSPMHGGEPTDPEGETLYGREFSRGHFNQHVAGTGSLRVGDREWSLRGYGWRDHSWGPRYWQNNACHRLLLANFGEDAAFMVLKRTDLSGRTVRAGVFMVEGRYEEVRDCDVLTEWTSDLLQKRIAFTVRTDRDTYCVEGEVDTVIPLRNRRQVDGRELRTRIGEAMTRWRWGSRTGWGVSEYLDQIVDGRPVGYPG